MTPNRQYRIQDYQLQNFDHIQVQLNSGEANGYLLYGGDSGQEQQHHYQRQYK